MPCKFGGLQNMHSGRWKRAFLGCLALNNYGSVLENVAYKHAWLTLRTCSAHIDFSLPLPNTHNTSSFILLTIIITLYSSINSRVVITMERKAIAQWVKAGEPSLTFSDSAVLVHDQNETTPNDQSTLRHYSNYCLAGNIKFERPNPHTVINTLAI